MEEMRVLNIKGIDCYEKDGTAYLKLETVVRGLGFTREKNGTEYVMWDRVNKYLSELGFHTSVENSVPTYGHDDFIPENIFYRLAMKAKNETAERFQALVANDIIPSIRKHGAYMTSETLEKALTSPDFLIQLATKLKEEQERNKALKSENERMKPKEIFADAVSASDNSMLVRDVAKMIRQNGVPMGEKRFYKWLRENGYICKGTTSPTQKAMELGLFEVVVRTVERGSALPLETKTTKVTGKGQQYFINKFLN